MTKKKKSRSRAVVNSYKSLTQQQSLDLAIGKRDIHKVLETIAAAGLSEVKVYTSRKGGYQISATTDKFRMDKVASALQAANFWN